MRTGYDLWSAARQGDTKALEQLLGAVYAINERDVRGYSPLMLAVYAGQEDGSRWLLEHGADPNSRDLGGNTILMGAAFKGHLALVRTLVAAGADPGARNESGLTALDFAVTFGRSAVADYLREAGAPPTTGRLLGLWRILMGRLKTRFG